MRILLQNSLFHPNMVGGAEQSTLLLARELSVRGHHVDIMATTGREDVGGKELRAREFDGISGHVFEATPGGSLPLVYREGEASPSIVAKARHHLTMLRVRRWQRHVEAICQQRQPEVLHTNTIVGQSGLIWRAAKEARVAVLHTLRDYQLLCPRTTLLRSTGKECERAPVPCRVLRSFQRPLTKDVDIVTAPSRFVLERHLREGHFPTARAEVVANAAGAPVMPRPSRAGKTVRLLYLGQLDSHKGVALLMDVLGEIFDAEALPALSIAFAGDGPLRTEIEAFVERYSGRASYDGFVDGEKKDQLLRQADALILPSIWNDNFPRVMLDAFRWALPVLGARRGGIPEVVQHERTGLLFEPEPDALRALFEDLCEKPIRLPVLGEAAHVESARYVVAAQVDRFEELYRSLSGGAASVSN